MGNRQGGGGEDAAKRSHAGKLPRLTYHAGHFQLCAALAAYRECVYSEEVEPWRRVGRRLADFASDLQRVERIGSPSCAHVHPWNRVSTCLKEPSLARVPQRLTGSLARAQPRWSPWTLAFSNTYRRQARRGQALTIRRTVAPEQTRVGCHPSRNKAHRCLRRQTRDPDIPLSLPEGIRCTALHRHRHPRARTRTYRDCQTCRRLSRNRNTSPRGWLTWGFSRLRTAKFPYVFLTLEGTYNVLTVCLLFTCRLRTHLRRKPSFLRAENAPHARIMTKASARPHSPRLPGRTCPQVNPRTSRPSSSPSRLSRRRRTA